MIRLGVIIALLTRASAGEFLPALAPVIRTYISGLLQFITGTKAAQTVADLAQQVGGIGDSLLTLVNITSDVFEAAKGAEGISQGVARDAGDNVAKVANDLKDITHHTYEVVIPHSLKFLYGYVESKDLVPLRQRVHSLEGEVQNLASRVLDLINWKDHVATPAIDQWLAFRKWFDTWPLQVVSQWHDWFTRPAGFGDWATPPIIGPLVAYLADKAHEDTRDNLAQIMVQAWSERPDRVLEAIETWLTTD